MIITRRNLVGRSHPLIGSNHANHKVSHAVDITSECGQRERGMRHLLLYYRAWTGEDFILVCNGSRAARRSECMSFALKNIKSRSAHGLSGLAKKFGITDERLYQLIGAHAPNRWIEPIDY